MTSVLAINQESARTRHPIAKRSHRTTTILSLNGASVNGIERIERWIICLVKDCASHAIPCADRQQMRVSYPAVVHSHSPFGARFALNLSSLEWNSSPMKTVATGGKPAR